MNCTKLTRLAIAGAVLLLSAIAPSFAAGVGPAANMSIRPATAQSDSNLVDVGYNRFYGNRFYGRRGYYGHRYGYGGGFRFFFAPVIVHDGYYGGGYGYGGPSCYRICRDYHGPDYCAYNWRRYCY